MVTAPSLETLSGEKITPRLGEAVAVALVFCAGEAGTFGGLSAALAGERAMSEAAAASDAASFKGTSFSLRLSVRHDARTPMQLKSRIFCYSRDTTKV